LRTESKFPRSGNGIKYKMAPEKDKNIWQLKREPGSRVSPRRLPRRESRFGRYLAPKQSCFTDLLLRSSPGNPSQPQDFRSYLQAPSSLLPPQLCCCTHQHCRELGAGARDGELGAREDQQITIHHKYLIWGVFFAGSHTLYLTK